MIFLYNPLIITRAVFHGQATTSIVPPALLLIINLNVANAGWGRMVAERARKGQRRPPPSLETNARAVAQTGDKLQSRCPGHCI